MNLAKLIVPSKTVWAEYPGLPGFEVQLAYLTRDELVKIRNKAVNNKISRKTRQIEEEVDNELFQSLYIQAVIKGWRGLKYKYLPKLVPTDISEVEPDDLLEYDAENAETLMKNSADFDSWVSRMLEDVENFTQNN